MNNSSPTQTVTVVNGPAVSTVAVTTTHTDGANVDTDTTVVHIYHPANNTGAK